MAEFTGERVIPGQVDLDLWNEHVARYAFAARRADGRRVLDAGCGVGYGSARLATVAQHVVGLEIAADAVGNARRHYAGPRLSFLRADCRSLPFADASFDLVVAFEVIEHLTEWERLLAESRRALGAAGELIISTPNRLYYAESRREPNPFHVREFDHREFASALDAYFPHVTVFEQNHAAGVVFSIPQPAAIETTLEAGRNDPDTSHFFVAVCSTRPLAPFPAFVYVPESGNVLRERERHIGLLDTELAQKNTWLAQAQQDLDELHRRYQTLEEEAAQDRLRAQQVVRDLEEENLRKTQWAQQVETEVERLKGLLEKTQKELDEQTQWALKLDVERTEILSNFQSLDEEANRLRSDLAVTVHQLHSTETDLADRTAWALSLDARVQQLTADLNVLFGSLAYRIGKRLSLCPEVPSDPRRRRPDHGPKSV